MKIASGHYTGNGTAQSITGLGFQPDLIFIKGDTTTLPIFRFKTMIGDKTGDITTDTSLFTGGITSIDADGFTVGADLRANTNAVVHYWFAIKLNDTAIGKTGTYTGNGTASVVTGVGFQPDLVIIRGETNARSVFRDTNDATTNAHLWSGTGDQITDIVSLDADGFTTGNAARANSNAITYHYIAIKVTASIFKTGTVAGNSTDDRNITGVGFNPAALIIKAGGKIASLRTSDMPGDLTMGMINTAFKTDYIQSLITDGFQLGANADVNATGTTYHYMAFLSQVSSSGRAGKNRTLMGAG